MTRTGPHPSRRTGVGLAAGAGVLLLILTGLSPAGATGQSGGLASAGWSAGHGRMHPAVGVGPAPVPISATADRPFSCQKAKASVHCYGPEQIRAAYGIQSLLNSGHDGTGRTIVIVDAFQDPTVGKDLKAFDNAFGLPDPPSFQVLAPFGLTPFDPSNADQVSWSGEIALDVEWAHAVAPGANIVLALARSDNDADLENVLNYAVTNQLGDVVSMSWGEAERCMAAATLQAMHATFANGTAEGVTFLAASGDEGATQYTCDYTGYLSSTAASTPATDPQVTAVGGTDLTADLQTGAYQSETVWNESTTYGIAGGGGYSTLYARPKYQNGIVTGPARGIPDVAYSASFSHAALVSWSSSGTNGGGNSWWIFDGTSVGTPQWAGLTAITDQIAGHDLGNINPGLYALGTAAGYPTDFHDITVGNNNFDGITGYPATPGWDPASGWGSPKANTLLPALAASPGGTG